MIYYEQHEEGESRLFKTMSARWAFHQSMSTDPFTMESEYFEERKKAGIHLGVSMCSAVICIIAAMICSIVFNLHHGQILRMAFVIGITLSIIYIGWAAMAVRKVKRPKECWDYDSDLQFLIHSFGLFKKLMSNDFDSLDASIGDQLTNAAIQIDAKRKLKLVLDADQEFRCFKEKHRIALKFGLARPARGWYFPNNRE